MAAQLPARLSIEETLGLWAYPLIFAGSIRRQMRRVLFFSCVMFFSVASLAQAPEKDRVLFTVDTSRTFSSEFVYLYKKNHEGKPDEFTKEKIQEYLELFVNFKLKVREARSRGMDTTRAFIDELESYKTELRKPYIASADQVTRLVKEAYERLQFEVRASHLLVSLPADAAPADTLIAWNKAMSLRKQIVDGQPFEKVAAQFSDDPTARENAGDLGYFTAMQMVYPFESAAYSLEPRQLSNPVRTRFGYHLIFLKDKRPASGEVEVSHIILRGKDEKVKNKAFDVYDQLKAGRKWEEVCKEYSEDTGTRDNGGRLQRFSLGTIPLPEFEAMAFSLEKPGDISDPFQSSLGWHIIRLEQKYPTPSFQEVEASLKRRISRDERLQIGQQAELSKRMKEYNVVESERNVNWVLNSADTSLQKGRWTALVAKPRADSVLFNAYGKPTKVSSFYSYVARKQKPSALAPATYLKQLYNQFLEAEIARLEDEKLQRENADYRNLLREYREGIMLFSIMEQEVWNKASSDSIGQLHYYDTHLDRYKAGERVYARVFGTPDSTMMNQLKEKIGRKDTLKSTDLRKLKIVTGFRGFERGENKAIDLVSWAVGLHETQSEGMYYLVEVERLIPAGVKAFSEARASVISDYQEEMEKAWTATLRKKYRVKMMKPAVKAVIAQLEKK
jgi:peptidyl-prolyl cis-trans isomerase SurA